jgi:signal transduction histidine kinase
MRACASCLSLKAGFLGGKRVGTLLAVRAVDLGAVLVASAAVALALGVARRALLRGRGVPAGLARAAEAIPEALGDAVLVLDRAGRIVRASPAAAALAGRPAEALSGLAVAEVSPGLAALARGLERGPASARLALAGPAGVADVLAVLVTVSSRPPLALAVLRPLPRPSPPPLPAGPGRPWSERGEARAGLAAAASALAGPVAEAAGALSLLRLGAPPLPPAAAAALSRAEAALEVAVRRAAALETAGEPAPRRPVDLAAVVEDLVRTFPAPPGVRVVGDHAAARAVADDRPVRAALRELLTAFAAALPGGGEIAIAVHAAPRAATIEVRAPADAAPGGLALARALVAPQGGRVEEDGGGHGAVVRVVLERAAALEPA